MRVKLGKARLRSKKRLFREAKGFYGGRSKLLRSMKESVTRARRFAYRDRRQRKRDFRRLWITRITAACLAHELSYSKFIHGLLLANVELNRKSLSEIAIHAPDVFAEIVAVAREALQQAATTAAA